MEGKRHERKTMHIKGGLTISSNFTVPIVQATPLSCCFRKNNYKQYWRCIHWHCALIDFIPTGHLHDNITHSWNKVDFNYSTLDCTMPLLAFVWVFQLLKGNQCVKVTVPCWAMLEVQVVDMPVLQVALLACTNVNQYKTYDHFWALTSLQ